MLQLSTALTANINPAATPSVPEYVAADGNASNPYAAANAINNLSGVTITNANLTASDIVASNYLRLSGGTLTGTLNVPMLSASSTNYGLLTATDASTSNCRLVLYQSVYRDAEFSALRSKNDRHLQPRFTRSP